MHLKVHGQPDGSFDVSGVRYRLEQDGDHFAVVRSSDGAVIGGFRLNALPRATRAAVIDEDSREAEIVEAIATVVSQPRGLLPLQ
jgi:hypothetical protein